MLAYTKLKHPPVSVHVNISTTNVERTIQQSMSELEKPTHQINKVGVVFGIPFKPGLEDGKLCMIQMTPARDNHMKVNTNPRMGNK